MATSQQIHFAETIRAMKAALKRKPSDSSDDDPITSTTNRGHKLQRGARHARSGRLDQTGGLAWRQKTEHAGYTRYTIARNPALYDADGDIYDPQISDDEREAEPVEEDAFGSVQLEYLLRPLTSAAELAEHPSLSLPYKSHGLTEMKREAEEMLRREERLLWKAKRLLRRLRGDADWVPCGVFEAEGDDGMLVREGFAASAEESVQDGMEVEKTIEETEEGQRTHDAGQHTAEANNTDTTRPQPPAQAEQTTQDPTQDPPNPSQEENPSSPSDKPNQPHAMTTRARARSPHPSPSPTPSDSASIPDINPWFLPASTSQNDSNLGLPFPEAEETRRILLLYTQKQDQIIRSLRTLYSNLAKADRVRREVYHAAKAEGHTRDDGRGNRVTEMSDGEDWYDVEALGLERGDLRVVKGGGLGLEKGKEEVEDVEEDGVGGRRGGRRRRVNRM